MASSLSVSFSHVTENGKKPIRTLAVFLFNKWLQRREYLFKSELWGLKTTMNNYCSFLGPFICISCWGRFLFDSRDNWFLMHNRSAIIQQKLIKTTTNGAPANICAVLYTLYQLCWRKKSWRMTFGLFPVTDRWLLVRECRRDIIKEWRRQNHLLFSLSGSVGLKLPVEKSPTRLNCWLVLLENLDSDIKRNVLSLRQLEEILGFSTHALLLIPTISLSGVLLVFVNAST